ncbi:RnfABCDGE type electron transport complex subunit D [Patescibacteria group bacterium]|nr:RnfABCDGE type electron transport complex subunit D [Patescibacteria group bacterium]
MKYIDSILIKITMYRLTLYYLIFLVGTAVVLSFFGYLNFSPLDIMINAVTAVIVSYIFNVIFAKMFKAVTNFESVFITALILTLIVPVGFPKNFTFIALASAVAMASKYFLTVDKKHIFNPAAAAVAGIAMLSTEHMATWWVGTTVMVPFVLVGGLLLVRRIQREDMVFHFLLSYILIITAGVLIRGGNIDTILVTWRLNLLNTALFFFLFVMFTEPLTAPTTKRYRQYYAYFVALLYSTPSLRLGIVFTPELALVIGNVFSYIINPTSRIALPLKSRIQLSHDTFEFVFNNHSPLKFSPGQYMEWTLPHQHMDSRGSRRYFSISSSPTENDVSITVKFYNPSSSFKKELLNMEHGKEIIASQVAGDFVLPKDFRKPLAFIAGGVGIAPFRSMIKYIVDNNLQVDIVVIFANRTKGDIIYSELFERAKHNGVRTVYVLTDAKSAPHDWTGVVGHITEENIKDIVPSLYIRDFYISGPQLMVERFTDALKKAGVNENKIITDFFPGYSEM